ncbi:radical SAM protein [Salinisphaera orenii MK-B5]|uniref:Radical SAM protein n=1 Tax=Salinisphaera orenii MK-B5 TaxID=856730 RepID=A0A423PIF5_9GAMM|nr:MSMEG_0568 family radical SAM protein [Salinisphaera orenii]ROO25334.1 radical SAM protein [Salinisphaera orenii MK-B5]
MANPSRKLRTEMQSLGLRLADPSQGAPSRRGGAGPSDHKAVTIDGATVMVPVHTGHSKRSPFETDGEGRLTRNGEPVTTIQFAPQPRFYARSTADGVPYWQIAQLHSTDVLATTVFQTCVRYGRRATSCQFCAIGQSLADGRTINRKTPAQLAEVARAAVELDGVKHMVMTTGTPNFTDRGAAILCESAFAVRSAVDLPIQAQCEPPDDPVWFARLKAAGVDSLGMHLEAVTPEVRARIMPGKAEVTPDAYLEAFEQAVAVFGRGQVSTYILAGLGDTRAAILAMSEELIARGVYPFVVPFVPITGTPLENHEAPSAAFMESLLAPIGRMLVDAGMKSSDIKAGCGRCGACSSLSAYESASA